MKKTTLFILLCAVCTLAGCVKLYEHQGTAPIPPIEITEANRTVTLPNVMEEGGVGYGSIVQTTFTANDGWSIDPANVPSWLTVEPMSGDKGTVTLNFSVKQENATWEEVAGEIVIKPLTGTPASIAVTQLGLSEGTIYVATEGSLSVEEGTTSIKIVGNLNDEDIRTLKGVSSLESINLLGVHLPENTLPENAFTWCESLKEITLPARLTTIGNNAFAECTSLTEITLPAGLTSIGNGAFAFCDKLTEITLPAGLTSIGSSAFAYCDKLTEITLPAGLTSIGSSAFAYCDKLTEITLPEGVTTIGGSAFAYCGSLTNISLPESLTTIGEFAFYGCDLLTNITLPAGLTTIGDFAFAFCNLLTTVHAKMAAPVGNADFIFGGRESLIYLKVPEGKIVAYENGDWGDFQTITEE